MLPPSRIALVDARGCDAGLLLAADATTGARLRLRSVLPLLAAGVIVTAVAVDGYFRLRADVLRTNPAFSEVDVSATLFPISLTLVLVRADNEFAPWRTTDREIVSSVALWRRMHLMHWNSVPEGLRTRALDNMLTHYSAELFSPQQWDRMTVEDWDRVPQPVRTVAYRHMIDFWSGFYALGATYAIPPRRVADTLAAIVMTESWFDHRAHFTNAHGNQDLGLAQASDFARRRVRELYATGAVDVTFDDADYFDPWKATRFAALWMNLLLGEAGGDLDTATAAYHRGIASAGDARGQQYLQLVRQRLTRYIRNNEAPVAWAYVWRRARDLAPQYWPWLQPRSSSAR